MCKISKTFLYKKMKRKEEGRRKLFAEHGGLSLPRVATWVFDLLGTGLDSRVAGSQSWVGWIGG